MGTGWTYNLFSRTDGGGQCCAVRQDQPIPSFLDGLTWGYVRPVTIEREIPFGFDADDAAESTRVHGFYMFRGSTVIDREALALAA